MTTTGKKRTLDGFYKNKSNKTLNNEKKIIKSIIIIGPIHGKRASFALFDAQVIYISYINMREHRWVHKEREREREREIP